MKRGWCFAYSGEKKAVAGKASPNATFGPFAGSRDEKPPSGKDPRSNFSVGGREDHKEKRVKSRFFDAKKQPGPATRFFRGGIEMQNSKGIPLYVTYNGRRVISGIRGNNGVFRKQVETRQKLLVLDAYGLDYENFQELKALGCQQIELTERDTGRRYAVDFDTFMEKAVPRQIGKFGLRYYLPLRYWHGGR